MRTRPPYTDTAPRTPRTSRSGTPRGRDTRTTAPPPDRTWRERTRRSDRRPGHRLSARWRGVLFWGRYDGKYFGDIMTGGILVVQFLVILKN